MKVLHAFVFASRGILRFFRFERNGYVQLLLALFTALAGMFFGITRQDWLHISICIGMVFAAEMMNTAIEKICDLIHPEQDPRIRDIKDLAAGAVLTVSLASAVIGVIIFSPYLFRG
jgi:diacylglycerol kinase (ATP)